MNDQAEKSSVEFQEQLHREVTERTTISIFRKAIDMLRDGKEYAAKRGFTEAEIEELLKRVSGEGD